MTKRKLPQADIATRPGLRTEIKPMAFQRWNADVRYAAGEDGEEATISILDVIGEDWFGEGVTSKRIGAALRQIGERDVTVTINSPGGDYFEGLAIYNMLREHKAKVTVKIVGMAASAASIIAMAGDEIQIARAGFIMIHNVWVLAVGDKNELREVASWLEPFDEAAVDIYAARTGIDRGDLAQMLDDETWIGGSQAVEEGFADALLPSDQVDASAKQAAETKHLHALRQIDALLAKAGQSRSERRGLLGALNEGGKPGAAPTGTQDAAVIEGLNALLTKIETL